jgi:energy-coupling factor transporter transmembrane protein EcfT
VRYAKSKAIQNLIDRKKMKKENLYYLSGILLLALGSVSFYVILIYWLFAILILSGITLIAISDKKIWLKIVTIFIVPIISVFLFFLSLIVFSNEAI